MEDVETGPATVPVPPTRCPGDDELAAYVEGVLSEAEHTSISSHLDACAACRRLVSDAARDDSPAPKARGALLGRYVVLELIGSGAMGVVYAAFDPELDRKVALKLLRPEESPQHRDALRARLLREARALARLSHANVTTVLDVGTLGDEVFIAMELVGGTTLRGYLSAEPRSWREVVRVFQAAGEGLRAAHEAGVVHRDFKPDNVLVGDDGRVKVTDFGLARAGADVAETRDAPEPSAKAPAATTPRRPTIASRLTRTGLLAGTPAYMAPEQLAGAAATAASDQYAFAMALFEALFGERPDGKHAATARHAGRGAPAALRAIVSRGLAPSPEARWPSMVALLAALDKVQRRSSRTLLLVAGAGALGVGTALTLSLWLASPAASPCQGSALAFEPAWGRAVRSTTRTAILASKVADPPAVFAALDRELTRYGARYSDAHRDACEATRLRGEQSEAMMDRRMTCLAARLREAEALTRLLGASASEPGRAERAVAAAQSLPDVRACSKVETLASLQTLPEDPTRRARVLRFEEGLAASTNAVRLGDKHYGVGPLKALVAEAQAVGWTQGEARALIQLARGEHGNNRVDAAALVASRATAVALAARDDETLADAWLQVLDIEAYRTRRTEAEHAARQAKAANRRLGVDPTREATRLIMLARVYERAGEDYDRAIMLCDQARALLLQRGAPDDLQIAEVDLRLGNLKYMQARYDEALVLFERAAKVQTRALGASDPNTENTRANTAETLVALGRVAEGEAIFRAQLEHRPGRLYVQDGLATALEARGDLQGALVIRKTIVEGCAGTADPCARWAPSRLGELLVSLGRHREAIAPLEIALADTSSVSPYDVARTQLALARSLRTTKRSRERAVELAKLAGKNILSWAERYGGPYRTLSDAIALFTRER